MPFNTKAKIRKLYPLILIVGFVIVTLLRFADERGGQVLSGFADGNVGPGYTVALGDKPIIDDGATTDYTQNNHDMILVDGSGNTIAAWVDSNTQNLYFQKFDTNGDPVWGSPTVLVETVFSDFASAGVMQKLELYSDGNGGVIALYSNPSQDSRVVRVDGNGNFVWNNAGMFSYEVGANHDSSSLENDVTAEPDGSGGVYVLFSQGTRAYFQHILPAGGYEWAADVQVGVSTYTSFPRQNAFDILTIGGCQYVTFGIKTSSSVYRLMLQKVCAGVPAWVSPTLITTDLGSSNNFASNAELVNDGSGGVVILYTEDNEDNLVMQRIDTNGLSVWSPAEKIIQESSDDTFNTALRYYFEDNTSIKTHSDGTNIYVVYSGTRKSEFIELYFQKFPINSGTPYYGNGGKVLLDSSDLAGEAAGKVHLAEWGSEGFAVAFYDLDDQLRDRYGVMKFDWNGNPLWNSMATDVIDTNLSTRDKPLRIKVAGVYNDNLIMSVQDESHSGGVNSDIYYVAITDESITPTPTPTGTITVTPTPSTIPTPVITAPWIEIPEWVAPIGDMKNYIWESEHDIKLVDNQGNSIAAWSDDNSEVLHIMKFDKNGNRVWANEVISHDHIEYYFSDFQIRVIPDGTGGALIAYGEVWYDDEPRLIRVNSTGSLVWPTPPSQESDPGGIPLFKDYVVENYYTQVEPGPNGSVFAASVDDDTGLNIILQQVDINGNYVFPNDIILGTSGLTYRLEVQKITYDPVTGCVFVGFVDYTGLEELFVQKICSGVKQWSDNGGRGILVADNIETDSPTPSTFLIPIEDDGGVVVLTEEYFASEKSVLGYRLDGSGNHLWDPTGVNVINKSGSSSHYPDLYVPEAKYFDRKAIRVDDPISGEDVIVTFATDNGDNWITTYMQKLRLSDGSRIFKEDGKIILNRTDWRDPGFWPSLHIEKWDDNSFVLIGDYDMYKPDEDLTNAYLIQRFDYRGNWIWPVMRFPNLGFTDWSQKSHSAGIYKDGNKTSIILSTVLEEDGPRGQGVYFVKISDSNPGSCNYDPYFLLRAQENPLLPLAEDITINLGQDFRAYVLEGIDGPLAPYVVSDATITYEYVQGGDPNFSGISSSSPFGNGFPLEPPAAGRLKLTATYPGCADQTVYVNVVDTSNPSPSCLYTPDFAIMTRRSGDSTFEENITAGIGQDVEFIVTSDVSNPQANAVTGVNVQYYTVVGNPGDEVVLENEVTNLVSTGVPQTVNAATEGTLVFSIQDSNCGSDSSNVTVSNAVPTSTPTNTSTPTPTPTVTSTVNPTATVSPTTTVPGASYQCPADPDLQFWYGCEGEPTAGCNGLSSWQSGEQVSKKFLSKPFLLDASCFDGEGDAYSNTTIECYLDGELVVESGTGNIRDYFVNSLEEHQLACICIDKNDNTCGAIDSFDFNLKYTVESIPTEQCTDGTDQDGDGICDDKEKPQCAQTSDCDNDGLSDLEELSGCVFKPNTYECDLNQTFPQTNPRNPDSDKDGLKDGEEVYGCVHKKNTTECSNRTFKRIDPKDPDTDNDGLLDGEEVYGCNFKVGTQQCSSDKFNSPDPSVFDTDGDCIGDGEEVDGCLYLGGTNSCSQFTFGRLDPTNPDSNDNGESDGLETRSVDECVSAPGGGTKPPEPTPTKVPENNPFNVFTNIKFPLSPDEFLQLEPGTGILLLTFPLILTFATWVLSNWGNLTSAFAVGILRAFPYFIWKRNRRPWGIVYDQSKNKPVAFAIVKLFKGSKFIQEVVTDLGGRYAASVESDKYKLTVNHDEYRAFSKQIIVESEQVIEDVPMKPKSKKLNKFRLSEKNIRRLQRINRVIFVLGFFYSLYVTRIYPDVINVLICLVYLIVFFVYVYRVLTEHKYYGKVVDIYGDSIEGAYIRLLDKKYGSIDVLMTNNQGRFTYATTDKNFEKVVAFKSGYIHTKKGNAKRYEEHKLFGTLSEFDHAQIKKGGLTITFEEQ